MHRRTFHIDMTAAQYLPVMQRLHDALKPGTYLEIGTRSGDSLRLSGCTSLAIDPSFEISADVLGNKPACHFFQQTSDRFFRANDIRAILGDLVDMAFLDGMHLAEFLLRDFRNVEKWCRRNSVVMMHDCLPSDNFMACRYEGDSDKRHRSVAPNWWTGDVWKAVWALRRFRPDLRIIAIDTPPTGLVCITNLDPTSTVLDTRYDAICREMTGMADDGEHLQDFLEAIEMIKPSQCHSFEDIARHFYL